MADALEKLRRKRGVIRGQITKLLHKVELLLAEEVLDENQIEDTLAQVSKREEVVRILDNEVENEISTPEEFDKEVGLSQEFLDSITLCRTKTSRALRKGKERSSIVSRNTPSGSASNAETESLGADETIDRNSRIVAAVKLPKINMVKFCGDVSKWHTFWNQYNVAVHTNETLTDSDKFTYLLSYLDGPAARAVLGMSISSENYVEAIDILTKRFGREELIIHTHMNNLLNLTTVKRKNDVTGLRQLYDACEVEVRSLKAMGVLTASYGSILCPILLAKIPRDIVVDFSRNRKQGNVEWSATELLKFLGDEVESLEHAFAVSQADVSGTGNKEINQRLEDKQKFTTKKTFPPSAAALTNGVQTIACCFCDSTDHGSGSCGKLSVQEKRQFIRDNGRCYICLKPRHSARNCRSKNKTCGNCGRKHHSSLCESPKADNQCSNQPEESTTTALSSINDAPSSRKAILLQTAVATATNGQSGKSLKVRVLLDSGSQRSFVTADVSRRLDLKVTGEENLSIYSFESSEPKNAMRRRVSLNLTNTRHPEKGIILEALETPQISSAMISVPAADVTASLRGRGFQIADDDETEANQYSDLSVLIGSDYYWQIMSDNFERLGTSLVAMETTFGWIFQGPSNTTSFNVAVNAVNVMKVAITSEEKLSNQIKAFWELDSLGIQEHETPTSHPELQESFKKSITFTSGRYNVRLPWKEVNTTLNDNYSVAKRRTVSLFSKLRKDPYLFAEYRSIINEQLSSGIIEESPSDDNSVNARYYMPHQAVVRADRGTTKVRVVFDASSHERGVPSLNDCLHSGPNLNPDLLSVLIRFRLCKIAFTADVEKAFLQISLDDKDRDAVRFLWNDNLDQSELKTLRMTRVPFGVTSSPFLLTATIHHHLEQQKAERQPICEIIRRSLYVDDLLSGAAGVKEAGDIATEAKQILGEAGMNLRKWRTNSPDLQSLLLQDITQSSDLSLIKEASFDESLQNVLGLSWKPKQDTLAFKLDSLLQHLIGHTNTKRNVLQAVARIFDPLGILSPFVIRMKALFQQLWIKGLGWDDTLPEDLAKKFETWCTELPSLQRIEVPRHYFGGLPDSELKNIEIHCFTDASEAAYAAVAYLRYRTSDGQFGVSLVTSKTRVAPLKKLSLPRLELMGAVLGARIVNFLKPAIPFKITVTRLWTDSTIILHWIRSSSQQWKPFVSNRVAEIQSMTEPQSWEHVRGKENPADLPTRGTSLKDLSTNQLWWEGPHWLKLERSCWPSTSTKKPNDEDFKEEQRSQFQSTLQASNASEPGKEALLDVKKSSSFSRIRRVAAWVLRFIHNARSKEHKQNGPLSADELNKAELVCIKQAQEEDFAEELRQLRAGKPLHKQSKLVSLDPVLDNDGVICVGGRLHQGQLTYRQKHPRILSGKNRLAELIAVSQHERLMHSGLRDTLAELRENFWILRGRQMVKTLLRRCVRCQRFSVKSANMTVAPLPRDRVTQAPAFEVTGLDFAGPLLVKSDKTMTKSYVALFTCAVTRAVHLELVTDLSTSKFLLAFRRFIARRGIPKTVYSDNAKTFKRADLDLKAIWTNIRSSELKDFLGEKGVTWKYIVERAPWWGGFWERLVRSVKTALKKVLGRSSLYFEELQTILAECEAILNSRPITFTFNDAQEPSPLTPGDFLIGQRPVSLPSRIYQGGEVTNPTKKQLTRRLQYRQQLLDRLWSRWKADYLMELRSAHHMDQPKRTTDLKVGDVVLINEDRVPRTMWKMGLIEEVFVGRDNKVRSCSLKLSGGSHMRRPIQLLHPLELY